MSKDEFKIREYEERDKEALLSILKLNTPNFFAASEEDDFVFYLENELEYYYVIEYNEVIVGGGGINLKKENKESFISWDLLHPDFQRKGIGVQLLNHRLEKIKTIPHINKITVRTSQHVFVFYEKSGFKTIEIVKDFWAPSFDLYRMEIKLFF